MQMARIERACGSVLQSLKALGLIEEALAEDASMDVGGVVWGACVSIGTVRRHLATDVFEPLWELAEGSDGEAPAESWGECAA